MNGPLTVHTVNTLRRQTLVPGCRYPRPLTRIERLPHRRIAEPDTTVVDFTRLPKFGCRGRLRDHRGINADPSTRR